MLGCLGYPTQKTRIQNPFAAVQEATDRILPLATNHEAVEFMTKTSLVWDSTKNHVDCRFIWKPQYNKLIPKDSELKISRLSYSRDERITFELLQRKLDGFFDLNRK